MTDDDTHMNRIASANEHVAQVTSAKLQAEMVNAQVSLERSLRQGALNTAVSLSAILKYESREQVIEGAEYFLAWLRGSR